ncbi:MAG: response regulator, partial [Cyanobacteria bacterium Co-bin13]|nr:response regulator [Cyanobacteria bacterium Co-bin13]
QVRSIAEVTKAVANGDLSKKITVDVKGEILDLKNTINTMVDQLSSFASEVTRVAREVGTEGKLGGQANVMGVAGVWKDLTDNVNSMAGNLTAQVRGIAKVVTAVANGDLKRKLMLDAKGEIETLADTINEMIDTLATFADQVTTVAREVGIEGKLGGQAKVPGAAGTWRDLTDNVNAMAANLTTQVRAIAEVATAVTKGDLTRSIAVEAEGEVAALKDNINQMIANLRETTQKNTEQDWLKTNLAKFTRMLQGQRDLETVSKLILSELAPLVFAQHGMFYLMDTSDSQTAYLKLISTYAYRERKHLANRFHLGEGLVGQCALEKERILLTEVPSDYIKISSGLGEASPLNVVVLPVLFEGQVTAVIELASFHRFSEIHLTFFDQLTESIAIVLNTIAASMRTEELLKQSQSLAEELQTQQKELTETNQRLEQQAQSLKASEELLKSQQEQLQQTNEELEEKAELLVLQKREVERKNQEIERARLSLEEKAEQLALTSKYKSEFLANMSHELRTPLNSLLILARLLSDNSDRNLSHKQVEYARTIHSSGTDLLELINDILDLAKIESGTLSVEIEPVPFRDLRGHIERTFHQVAQDKQLDFTIHLDERLPVALHTDSKRLQQVLKNLLANAFKFTDQGQVRLDIGVATQGWSPNHDALNSADQVITFAVTDTGIGIPADKQQIIFEAFQQVDGTTSRRYGGTGLGLSISREISRLLHGEIKLASQLGRGSTFTLYLPHPYPRGRDGESSSLARVYRESRDDGEGLRSQRRPLALPLPGSTWQPAASPPIAEPLSTLLLEQDIEDDRDTLQPGDQTLLIVEDDLNFASILLDMARQCGFKGIVATRGDVGLALAREFKPAAIMLDIRLPMMDGWMVLDRLKHELTTRHIPVHLMSVEDGQRRGLQQGALAFLQKPISSESISQALAEIKQFIERPVRNLLIVEDDEPQSHSIVELIGNSDVASTAVGTGAEALEALRTRPYDCLVLDLGLPDMTGFELIERIHQELHLKHLPIIVYTAKDLTPEEETELRRISDTIIIKDVKSPERLLDETSLFLHRPQTNLPTSQRMMLEQLQQSDPVLAEKKVLIVDDDVRNIFALTSLLERHRTKVIYAENGRDGIALLQNNPDVDLVIMDVMMPEMDGYQTISHIRGVEQFSSLPIIALTAKAMKGDREKCIEAGASDYITKPVDTDQLLSLLRVWLYQ